MLKTNKSIKATKSKRMNRIKKFLAGFLAVGSLAATGMGGGCYDSLLGQGFRGGNYSQSGGDDVECLYDPNCW